MNSGHYFCDVCQQPCDSSDCPDCDRPARWIPHPDALPRRRPAATCVPAVPAVPHASRSPYHELNAALDELAPPAPPRRSAAEWFRRMREAVAATGDNGQSDPNHPNNL